MTTLRLSGLELPDGQDPLGMWTLVPSGMYAYAGDRVPAPDQTLVWQVQVDRATLQAQTELRRQFEQADAAGRQIAVIGAHLEALDVGSDSRAYPVQAGHPFAAFDAVLIRDIESFRTDAQHYGAGETSIRIDQAVLEKCQMLYTQFRRILAYKTWIETDINGVDIGITTVDWGGDFTNVWKVNVSPEQRKTHMNVVRVALRSRQSTMQMITVVCAGALALALRAGIPGGQLLLLPSVYTYVREVLRAWTNWRSSQLGQPGKTV